MGPAIDEVLSGPRRRIDEMQKRIDLGIKTSLEHLRNHPAIGPELERVEGGLREIEARLKSLLSTEGNSQAGSSKSERDSSGPRPS